MTSRQSEIRSGAKVNALGLAGKLAAPVFLVLVNRLYGVDAFGVYVTAASLLEMGVAFLTAGFRDAALLFVARHSDRTSATEQRSLYHGLINAFAWGQTLALVLIVFTLTAGPELLPKYFPDFGDRLLLMLKWMVLVLPLMTFERVVLAATQGLKIMKYEAAVNGIVRPLLLVVLSATLWAVWPTLVGLLVAYVMTQGIIAILVVIIYSRELSWRELGRALRSFRPSREMVMFALPQNLNRTLERFITNIDVVMLGMFGFSASSVGLYGTGALIVREIRHVKLIFSSAFNPHIVQLYFGRRLKELATAFSVTARWIATWAIPIVVTVALLRSDLLRLVHPDFAGQDTRFMLILLVIPYLQSSVGLASNVVVMTGHSGFNLLNSATAAATNILLNLWWIPVFGAPGAAMASAVAAVVTATLETGEMVLVVKVRPLLRVLVPPHLGGLIAGAVIAAIVLYTPLTDLGLPGRLATVAASLGTYFAVVLAMRADRFRGFSFPSGPEEP